jgi:hypothetical protein
MAVKQLFNFDAEISNLDGKPLLDADGKAVQLKTTIANVLTIDQEGENLSFEEKDKRYKLARRIVKGGTIKLTMEEVNTIRKLTAQKMSTLVVGQISEALDADEPEQQAQAA